ncbi:MAG: hypothetical protein IIB05_05385 [Bacteroidetes bacterium]|nr:hypothetical protein [Bacteroidota bacterium]
MKRIFLLLSVTLLLHTSLLNGQTNIPVPEDHFGFKPGTDRMLFDYEELIEYFNQLDKASPKFKLISIGKSPMGKPIYIGFISSAENIDNLEQLKIINRELALNPEIPDAERVKMINEGKVFVLGTLSMHSGEVGPSQASTLIAHQLVTSNNPKTLEWLNNVVYMMIPCHNPDGMDMIVNNYRKYKGTKYEGASLPRVYHKYVGHDNNRDFVILSQEDTKAIARIYNTDWLPQVLVEKHQMGSTGPRYFVPPPHDPIAQNIDAGIWNWIGIFGQNMIKDMTRDGLSGISQHYLFDDYWPGSTETCIWKNVIGFLTESASVKDASPVYIEPNELNVRGKGLSEYKKGINMPEPWEGGWWRLGDIVDYEISSTMSILKTASLHREDILKFRNDICRSEVERGKTEPPFYYVFPEKQHDPGELVNLVALLKEHGVAVYRLQEDHSLEGHAFKSGDIVVPLAQPYRPFIKEVLEAQEYPVRHYTPGGEIIKPYDITTWSLPLHRNVRSFEIETRCKDFEAKIEKIEGDFNLLDSAPEKYWAALFSVKMNYSYKAAFTAMKRGLKVDRLTTSIKIKDVLYPKGSFVIYNKGTAEDALSEIVEQMGVQPGYLVEKENIKVNQFIVPRIALIETYTHDMDAGWTRFVFDSYNIPYTVIHPQEINDKDLEDELDVIVFPDASKSLLMKGKYSRDGKEYVSSYPPEYAKGMGKEGLKKVLEFVDKGGVVVSWGQSTALFEGIMEIGEKENKEEFQLPFRDVSSDLRKSGLYVAGALIRVQLKDDHPLTLGMPDEIGIFYRGKPAFTTSLPGFDTDRRIIASFPEKDLLLSGYSEKEKLLGRKAAMVWLKKGKGQLVIFAFNPQFRASTQSAYKLLFNSILLP